MQIHDRTAIHEKLGSLQPVSNVFKATMETERDRLVLASISSCLKAIKKQSDAIESFASTLQQLANSITAHEASRSVTPALSNPRCQSCGTGSGVTGHPGKLMRMAI